MVYSEEFKQDVFRRARRYRLEIGRPESIAHLDCVGWMVAGLRACTEMGINVVPQAGSAAFKFRDDDVRPDEPNVIEFRFDESPAAEVMNRIMALQGQLPEIHCWLGIIESQELIDFTVGYLPESLEARGFKYELDELPPPFVWTAQGIPNAYWEPSARATQLAITVMDKLLKDYHQSNRLGL